ncbi:MAG: Gfo/Idh/MocA family oxidoreductase [Opitutaceae bacterium]|nr:Gfo/Idh/MocA family oxidoreductase [Opitutaceae bacterium]
MQIHSISRRRFIKTSAVASFGFSILPAGARGANSRIQVGCIGINGKGYQDTMLTAEAGAAIVALCDVADPRDPSLSLQGTKKGEPIVDKFPHARFFTDYRDMIANMQGLDAVVVSTPDHHHFHATMLAMQKGLHAYTQKPVSHSIWEARRLAEEAAKTKVQTQMGNQAHAGEPIRRGVELIRAGVIGRVTEVHTWTNRPIWPQGMTKWPDAHPVPRGLDWEQWIGPAPFREYSPEIAPFNWRGFWDFGAGALGDMGCHIMDMPYWALGLTAPESVDVWQQGGTEISAPIRSTVTFRFSNSHFGIPVNFAWYDGVSIKDGAYLHTPPEEIWKGDFPTVDHVVRRFDLVLIGEKGKMYFERKRQDWVFKPETLNANFRQPKTWIPRVPGGVRDGKGEDTGGAYFEWLEAIRTGKPALSNFASAGPLSETVLLGNLALRLGRRIEWNAKAMTVKNAPEAASIVRRAYRKGWEIA